MPWHHIDDDDDDDSRNAMCESHTRGREIATTLCRKKSSNKVYEGFLCGTNKTSLARWSYKRVILLSLPSVLSFSFTCLLLFFLNYSFIYSSLFFARSVLATTNFHFAPAWSSKWDCRLEIILDGIQRVLGKLALLDWLVCVCAIED
jgi:hypothetical protein